MKFAPAEIKNLIAKFYIFLLIFSFSSWLLFSPKLTILNVTVSKNLSVLVNALFFCLVVLIYVSIKRLYKFGLWLAIFFHFLFLVNNLLVLFGKKSLILVESYKKVDNLLIILVAGISIIVNLVIIIAIFYIHGKIKKNN